jgi:DNA-binding response OmpR family regulator
VKKKVMVIDDDVEYLSEVEYMLKTREYDVYTVAEGIHAFRKVKEIKPDIILLDLRMKGKSGLFVFSDIKETDEVKHIPIIVVTGAYSDMGNSDLIKSFGVQEYLIKPFDYNELFAKIEKY